MFGRTRNLLSGSATSAPPAVQHYVLRCLEGHELHGTRTESYQAIRCPTCGSGIFVLPRSPLPDLPADAGVELRSKTKDTRGRRDETADLDSPIIYQDAPPPTRTGSDAGGKKILWLDDEETTGPDGSHQASDEEILAEFEAPVQAQPRPKGSRPSAGAGGRDRQSARPETVRQGQQKRARAAVQPDEDQEEVETDGSQYGGQDRTPVLARLKQGMLKRKGWLAGLAAVGIVVSTLALNTWRSYREQLPHTAEVNYNEGTEAFDQGDYDTAKLKLGRAATAFKQLGGQDERTTLAIQLAAESAIFADLCTYRLDEILDEAARTDADAWARRFEIAYKGRAVILDTEIEGPTSPGASAGDYPLRYRILLGRGPTPSRIGRISLDRFKLFEGQSLQPGDPVLFGARLAGCRLQNGEWQFLLEPDSGVILTRFENLKRQGWTPRDNVNLDSQVPRSLAR